MHGILSCIVYITLMGVMSVEVFFVHHIDCCRRRKFSSATFHCFHDPTLQKWANSERRGYKATNQTTLNLAISTHSCQSAAAVSKSVGQMSVECALSTIGDDVRNADKNIIYFYSFEISQQSPFLLRHRALFHND